MGSTEDDVNFIKEISSQIVNERISTLDNLMDDIRNFVVNVENVDDRTIEQYLLKLTNELYFIVTQCESVGFFDDITKANARLKYIEAYTQNQVNHANDTKKPTQGDHQIYAEQNSVDENALNIIYSRSVKIIKGKIDAANEMVRTLSKLLSVHMNMGNYSSLSRKFD